MGKRVIEETASNVIFNDDWFLKDSPTQGTTKLSGSDLKSIMNTDQAKSADLADAYDPNHNYVEGDVCIHDDTLHKANDDTTGPWDSTKWDAVTVAELLDSIDLSAEAISYDNTSSGLEAENVQDAIDETITKLSAVGSASGAIATFTDGSALPMPSLKVAIEPQQEGSGEPSPTNVRPISGWDECNVEVSGVNLLDYDKWKNSSVTRGTAIWEDNGVTITATGNDAYVSPTNSKTFVKEGQTIILKWEESTNKEGAIYLFPNGSTEGMAISYNQTVKNLTYTVPSGVTFITFRFGVNNSGETIAYKNIRLEFGNQSPTFVPYNGSTFNIKFPSEAGIVYGAILDVLNGLLTVTHVMVDLGNGNWEQNSYVTSAYNLVVSGIKKGKLNEKSNMLCEALATAITVTATSLPNLSIMVANGAPIIVARDDNYISNPTDFKTAMNGVKLVYELETPQTYQLTPTEVKTILGINNILADTGNILDAEYIRDLTTIIDYILEQLNS